MVIDAEYQTTLADEYLLNDRGRLEIHKVYDCSTKSPKLKGIFARSLHPSVDKYDDLLTLKLTELKKRAKELDVELKGINQTVNSALRQAIWNHGGELTKELRYVSLGGDGGKSIWEQLAKQMPLFQLFRSDRPSTDQDDEAQDPMKTAVKEALRAKEAELKVIAQSVEKEVRAIAEATVKKIKEMDPKLAQELHPQFTPPKWDSVFKISLTDDAQIPVNKRGSGVRRLILLNFFRARAERLVTEKQACGVIYAVEEPETSQHPDYQRMLLRALQELSETHGCQVLLTTHTPTLARLLPLDSLRYIECSEDGGRQIHHATVKTYELVTKALGVLPDNDVRLFIGVEGVNDISFLQRISRVLHEAGEAVPHLEQLEAAGTVVFIPLGGQSLERWVGRLKELNRPEYHLFDREEAPPKQPKYHATVAKINAQPRCTARSTDKLTLESYLHPDAITEARHDVVVAFGPYDDVPPLIAKAIHDASGSPTAWAELEDRNRKSKVSNVKHWLNSDAVLRMTADRLTASDPDGHVRGWLGEIAAILTEPI